MKNYIVGVLVALSLVACANNNLTNQETKMKTNKEKVVALLNAIESGESEPIGYINPNKYIQHNLAVGDGLDGFAKVMQQLPKGSAKVQVIRAFEDGDFVFTHTKYNFFGPKSGFDIFRFEDGMIVEHWDNLQEIVDETASGRTQFDGETKIVDRDKTKENKLLVKNFIEEILIDGNVENITAYISNKHYLQHNPHVKDGLDGLAQALEGLAKAGIPMIVKKNHMLMGEGNFVLAVNEGTFMKKHVAFYDLFRIEDGKIVEHWDTIEEIPEKSQWKNDNGKF